MGAVCCCLSVEDFEDYVNPNSSVYRNCTCLSCFIQSFLNAVSPILVVFPYVTIKDENISIHDHEYIYRQ